MAILLAMRSITGLEGAVRRALDQPLPIAWIRVFTDARSGSGLLWIGLHEPSPAAIERARWLAGDDRLAVIDLDSWPASNRKVLSQDLMPRLAFVGEFATVAVAVHRMFGAVTQPIRTLARAPAPPRLATRTSGNGNWTVAGCIAVTPPLGSAA